MTTSTAKTMSAAQRDREKRYAVGCLLFTIDLFKSTGDLAVADELIRIVERLCRPAAAAGFATAGEGASG